MNRGRALIVRAGRDLLQEIEQTNLINTNTLLGVKMRIEAGLTNLALNPETNRMTSTLISTCRRLSHQITWVRTIKLISTIQQV